MKQIESNGKRWLFVPVSEDEFGISVIKGRVHIDSVKKGQYSVDLAPGILTPLATTNNIAEKQAAEVVEEHYKCPACGGDGNATCNNPDHGFIEAMPGEIGRLGCPGCGHDPNHKIRVWRNNKQEYEVCNECGGHGEVLPEQFDEYARITGYDNEPESILLKQSLLTLMRAHGLEGNHVILEMK